jgi:hypothetical protein
MRSCRRNQNSGWSAFCGALLALALAGCKPSEPADTAPMDIRGAPIGAAPVQTGTQLAPPPERPAPRPLSTPEAPHPEYVTISFDTLSAYDFELPEDDPTAMLSGGSDEADAQIPDDVKAFNKRKVSLTGFMLPLKVQSGKVTEFLVLKDQSMCCYGAQPKMNEWVSVKVSGGVKSIMDEPISVLGTLHVGALRENGYLVGIYSMDGDRLIGPTQN